ncbi:Oxysterol-binding protein [Quillaja saponaria]|uniref:Oxysterol-binding protein n=1 Tax=Quillaja saponaria TaxID=32244 RepID=A0AAD7LG13_QUISA|nr:Oxysterol-binding protein [Quillaja saponaria]
MVCSIRESESDEKRFSIYTGTKKRLHLRAESREDRVAWLEALHAVKDMFPRISNAELMAPAETVVVSTEKLRQRLVEEGVSEAAIQDSENIMRSELSELHKHVFVLKHKQLLLMETLRHLETEKVDLENTLVDESQNQAKELGSSFRSTHEKDSEGSGSDSYDEHDMHDAAEEDTDDDNNSFVDTRDYFSTSSFRSNGSDFQRLSLESDDDPLDSDDGIEATIRSVGSNYPHVRRRKKLPDPVEKEKGVSLWSMIKENIGKDLTKVCLPVYFNEPISSLQKCFEELEYSYLLDRAYECGKMGDSLMRILHVAAFAVSGYACTEGRNCKPFNPLLGETYEADYPDKGIRFVSEKVSHHPMIVACHCEGRGWKFWGDSNLKSKFWGRSIQLDPVGVLTLEFDDGEIFQWSKVTTSIYNLILGKLYCDHYGTMRIEGNRDYSCKIKFKEQSIIDRNPHQVQGIVQDKNGKTVSTLFGKWDESMYFATGDGKEKGSNMLTKSSLLWKRSKPPNFQTRYNFSRFAITLNEITPGLKDKLPPTDSRLRPDQRSLENGEYEMANSEKLRLEQRQRQARKMQEKGWKPRWFTKDKGSDTYHYVGGYWEAREKGNWAACPNIFGQVPTDTNLD